MNLIVIPSELLGLEADVGAEIQLTSTASEHARKVLRKSVGDHLRVGIENGSVFRCEITNTDAHYRVRLVEKLGEKRAPRTHLLVALPRPKAVSRLVQTAASFGIASLTFVDGWKVDKSYFESPRLVPERLRADAILGAEQGAHTLVPDLSVERGFRRFVEDVLPQRFALITNRYYFDPSSEKSVGSVAPQSEERLLAFGPEGGFIPAELESFRKAGFQGLSLRTPILTTEIAVAAALAQFAMHSS